MYLFIIIILASLYLYANYKMENLQEENQVLREKLKESIPKKPCDYIVYDMKTPDIHCYCYPSKNVSANCEVIGE